MRVNIDSCTFQIYTGKFNTQIIDQQKTKETSKELFNDNVLRINNVLIKQNL